jgi:hypothetical protein
MAVKKRTKQKPPNINAIRERIHQIVSKYNYDAEILLEFAEFVNGGKFKPTELTMNELKKSVWQSFGCKNYAELKKNANFKVYVADMNLKLNTKTAWQQIYREWVDLPESERNAIGYGSINGINIFRNFRPWEVFGLDPKTASAEDIKSSFRKLAQEYHPDKGGDRRIFEKLQQMRDSLLAVY